MKSPLEVNDAAVRQQMRRLSRRGFLGLAAGAAATIGGWQWLRTRRDEAGVPWPLRRALETNEDVWRDYFRTSRLAPTFAREQARTPRPNGTYGMDEGELAEWQLTVTGLADAAQSRQIAAAAVPPKNKEDDEDDEDGDTLTLTLAHIQALPKIEFVTELKCIEGWSEIVHWGGARLADFIARYQPETQSGQPVDLANRPNDLPAYVSLTTPEGGYYVGLERESAIHPQTLLAYEMNGAPLTEEHGAPLRLVIPVKYGIKNIKRIGAIEFTNKRPADFWAEQGYDWYAGH